jgi:large subunit ribosomal protein L24
MKKKFSVKWKGSSKARKQRKYRFNAPLHLKQKLMGANLSKELRKTYGKRSIEIRKNDIIRILNGKFRNKKGKVLGADVKRERVTVEGIQITKRDGSKAPVTFHPSNLQIIELNNEDKKRIKKKNESDNKKSEIKK